MRRRRTVLLIRFHGNVFAKSLGLLLRRSEDVRSWMMRVASRRSSRRGGGDGNGASIVGRDFPSAMGCHARVIWAPRKRRV
jgi:hypothetical protein